MSEQPFTVSEYTTEPQTADEQQALADEDMGGIRPFSLLLVAGTVLLIASFVVGGWMYGMSAGGRQRATAHTGEPSPALKSQSVAAGDPQHGRELFGMTCIACHGPSGSGIPNLGANLRESKFVASKTDPQLVDFIKRGRQPGEPGSVLGLMMPPKGGNPTLDDAGLRDIVAFIRTLQADAKQSLAGLQ